jgi:hypothetical protein
MIRKETLTFVLHQEMLNCYLKDIINILVLSKEILTSLASLKIQPKQSVAVLARRA